MGLSFLSLLYLQVSYIEEMVKMRRSQFEENVNRSLGKAVHNLELVETKKISGERCRSAGTCSTVVQTIPGKE